MTLPDFDTLLEMAQTDPEALELLRQEKSELVIKQASEHSQQRLRGLMFQIDAQRSLHSCAMGACIKISKMMHVSLGKLPEAFEQFHTATRYPSQTTATRSSESGKILHFQAPSASS